MLGIIDLGIGNINSVSKALHYLGEEHTISDDKERLNECDKLIFPGVGSFNGCMDAIHHHKFDEFIYTYVEHAPILGICVGMQVLAETGVENGNRQGLGLIPGIIEEIHTAERLPHVGWNGIKFDEASPLFQDVGENDCVYFTHSYCLNTAHKHVIAATTTYGCEFICAVQSDNVYGVQFHPEKSQRVGLKILKNFITL